MKDAVFDKRLEKFEPYNIKNVNIFVITMTLCFSVWKMKRIAQLKLEIIDDKVGTRR